MGRACNMNEGEQECVWDIGKEARRKDQDIVGWTILKWILEE
jgi:hypothetical protein